MSKRRILFNRYMRNKPAVAGATVLILVTLFAIFGPIISPYTVSDLDLLNIASPPDGDHWLGTNIAGADVFVLLATGTRISLLIGVIVGVCTPIIAVVYGLALSYFGGKVEKIGLFLLELLIMMPAFLLIAIVMGGKSGGWVMLAFLLVLFGWMSTARLVRGLGSSLVTMDYIKAARYMGVPGLKIIWRHMVPNIASLVVLNITLGVTGAVLAEVIFSYLGIGIKPPDTSLGLMLQQSSNSVTLYPWLFWPPVLTLMCITIPLSLVNDGLRDAFDPNSQSGGKA